MSCGLGRDAIGSLSPRGQGQHISLVLIITLLGILHGSGGTGHTVGPISPILRRLDHGWQLQLLIVRVIALVPSIPLPVAHDLLVQDHLLHLVARTLVTGSHSLPHRAVIGSHKIHSVVGRANDVSIVTLAIHVKLVEMVRAMDD
jgi:hypothetical protein